MASIFKSLFLQCIGSIYLPFFFFFLRDHAQETLRYLRYFKVKSEAPKRYKENPVLRVKVRAKSSAKNRHWEHSKEGKQTAMITAQMVLNDQNQLVPNRKKKSPTFVNLQCFEQRL